MKALYKPTISLAALKATDVFERDKRHQMLMELEAFSKVRLSVYYCFKCPLH